MDFNLKGVQVARQDSDAGRRLRAAYRAAWADRGSIHDVSDGPLLERLRAGGVEEALDESSPIHQIVFGLWRKGVPPRRLNWELMKFAGRAVLQLGDTGLVIRDAFNGEVRLQEAWEIPEGKRGVTMTVHRPPSTMLNLERNDETDTALRECLDEPSGLGGWRRPPVWFLMNPVKPVATVMVGAAAVGTTRVPNQIWTRMIEAESESLYADGTLEVKDGQQGDVVTGTLICTYLADGPITYLDDVYGLGD